MNKQNPPPVKISFYAAGTVCLGAVLWTVFRMREYSPEKRQALFAMGGLFMGLGTRFANGCNVGALYTPIANLSLSGWILFVALVGGGILGNRVAKRIS